MKHPYTIGITGGSGSGKTMFLNGLAARLGSNGTCFISQDNYYRLRELQPVDARGIKNFDLPESIDRAAFHGDLLKLKAGEKVVRKEYTFNNPEAQPRTLELNPAPLLIVEGLFVQYFEEIDKELDLRLFIEAKDHIKLGRRIRRDQVERGYDLDDVLYRYEFHVMPVYEALIEPLQYKADLVIPNNRHFEAALDVLTTFLKTKVS